MNMLKLLHAAILLSVSYSDVLAWTSTKNASLTKISIRSSLSSSSLMQTKNVDHQRHDHDEHYNEDTFQGQRRQFVSNFFKVITISSVIGVTSASPYANAIERAVGGAEIDCRKEGNCLEKGEWDGAVGWNWGAENRCDPNDIKCGVNGKIKNEEELLGKPVPPLLDSTSHPITHEVSIDIAIGKSGEVGTIKFGLYGNDMPLSTKQLLDFMTLPGLITTSSKLIFQDGYGAISSPVSLLNSGIVTSIIPNERFDLGILSQQASYGKSKGIAKVKDFIPQSKPSNYKDVYNEPTVRNHDCAGLVSIPRNGLGYANGGASDDEAFASAFVVTASPIPSIDKDRRVIGQILDQESMSIVARISSLPTQKGIKGVIPGQNAGPPLFKVSVRDVKIKSLV